MVQIGFNERINAVGIGFEYAPIVIRELFCMLCCDATVQFHLPEAVLGMYIALREIEVIFVTCINMGYAIAISDNFNRLVQSTEVYCTILLRHRTSGEQRVGTTHKA